MNGTARAGRGMSFSTLKWFFAMAFGFSWGLVGLYFAFPAQLEAIFGPIGYTNPLFIVAVYAPGLSGISLVLYHYGFKGFLSYLKRLTVWRMPLPWLLYLVIGIPAAFYGASALKGNFSLSFPFTPWYSVLPALLTGLMVGPMEEFGWRGVALPLLQRRFRPITADLILSTLWAIWHVPAFFMDGTPQSDWSFPAFFIGVVSISFILTPLFNASGGSILAAAFYHFQVNNPIWPDAQPWDSLVFALVAVVIVVLNRKAMFSHDYAVTEVLSASDEERLGFVPPSSAGRAAPSTSPHAGSTLAPEHPTAVATPANARS